MTAKVKAIVIGNKDYKDKDKLITLYSLEKGKLFCSMRGVRGEKAKLKAAKEIFCFGEYIIEEKGMNIITQVDIIDSFFSLSGNLDKYYEGCAILDVVGKISTNESDPALFITLLKCLKALCYDNLPKFYCIDKFLIDILSHLGYFFLSDRCSSCKSVFATKRYFNLDIGELVCSNCRNATCISVSPVCFSALKLLAATDYDRLNTVHIGGGGEQEAYRLLCSNFEWRMGSKMLNIIN